MLYSSAKEADVKVEFQMLKMRFAVVFERFNKMLKVDYIIANEDRHYNNFGFIRNADTLEWLGLAPV